MNQKQAVSYISIMEAAERIGCDHHYVRSLVKQNRLVVDHTEPVNSSVNKVFLTKLSVKLYMEKRRVRYTYKLRLTDDEHTAVDKLLITLRQLPDW